MKNYRFIFFCFLSLSLFHFSVSASSKYDIKYKIEYAKNALSNKINNRINKWLNQYGTAEIDLGLDRSITFSNLNINTLFPIKETRSFLWYILFDYVIDD